MRKLIVVIAEDNETVGKLIALVLKDMGHTVHLAEDKREAISLADRISGIDVLITNRRSARTVPSEISGEDIIGRVRKRHQKMKAVLLTGEDPKHLSAVEEAGISIFLKKPVDLSELKAVIEEISAEDPVQEA